MILDKYYLGLVEDNIDLKRKGRVKVRVFGVFDEISVDYIPWASPQIISDGTNFNVPAIGKLVNVIFDQGCIYAPIYSYSEKYNINLQDKLSSLSDDEYRSFKALLFEHKTQIYADNDGLTLDHLINKIRITNTDINLEVKNNDGVINLGTANADQAAVLGNHFIMDFMMRFFKAFLKPTSLTGNLSAPILKPELDMLIQEFLNNPEKYISSNVFIVDNDKVETLERKTKTSEVEHDDTKIISPLDTGAKNVENTNELSKNSKSKIKSNQKKDKETLKKARPNQSTETQTSDYDSASAPVGNNDGTVFGDRGRTDTLDSSAAKNNSSSNIKEDPIYGTYKLK